MIIQIKTKFDEGEEVFVVFCNQVVKAKVIKISVFYENISYGVEGKFWNGTLYSPLISVYEPDVFKTEKEANEGCKKRMRETFMSYLHQIKMNACHLSRGFRISDFEDEGEREMIRFLKKANSYILKFIRKKEKKKK